MSKPLAGKRYFHALGNRARDNYTGFYLETAINHFGLRDCPLWAKNAFVDGVFGVELRRRPDWTEDPNKLSQAQRVKLRKLVRSTAVEIIRKGAFT